MEGRCDDHQVSYSCNSSCTIAFSVHASFLFVGLGDVCTHEQVTHLNWVSGWQFQSWEAVEGEGIG